MKKKLLLLLIVSSFSIIAFSQANGLPNTKNKDIDSNFAKGTMQIAIEGLNGWGHGRVSAGIGVRYGYFFAKNSLLFVSGEFSYYGNDINQRQIGLAYRKYFNTKTIVPYLQMGANIGWENFYEDKNKMFYNVTLGGGATFRVGKFGFDLGLQLNIWDNVSVSPRIGVSYSF